MQKLLKRKSVCPCRPLQHPYFARVAFLKHGCTPEEVYPQGTYACGQGISLRYAHTLKACAYAQSIYIRSIYKSALYVNALHMPLRAEGA
jgi:hypothetical protein